MILRKQITLKKLFFRILFVGLCTLLVVSYFLTRQERKQAFKQWQSDTISHSAAVMSSYYSNLVTKLILGQTHEVDELLKQVQKTEDIKNISIVPKSEVTTHILETCKTNYGKTFYHQVPTCYEITPKSLFVYHELRSAGHSLDYLVKEISLPIVGIFGSKILFLNIIFVLMCFIAVNAISLFYFRTYIMNPTRGIVASLEQNKKLDIDPNSLKLTELYKLATSLQQALTSIAQYQETIKQQAKLAAIGQTTAMLAHDVRKPFTLVKAFLDQVSSKRFDDDFIKKSEHEIDRSLAEVENMIEDTLEFTRDKNPELAPCNPQSLINISLRETFKIYEDTDINFRYDFKHRSFLNIDTMKAIRVFNNIIGNAIEAMDRRGEIWFKTEDQKEKNRMMEIVIGNSGPSISKEDQSNIFDPFFTKGKQKGTGLGLAISKKIVNLHGGDIKVRNDKMGGTEFILTFPTLPGTLSLNKKEVIKHSREIKYESEKEAYEQMTQKIKQIKEEISHANKPLKILVADDEPLFRSSLRNMINGITELRDYIDVVEVSCGEEALELLDNAKKQNPFSYVISDIDMGEDNLDGFEFVKRFLSKYSNAKVVIHSNWNLPDTEIRSKEAGAVGFLKKPMTKLQFIDFLMTGVRRNGAQVIPLQVAREKKTFDGNIISNKPKILIVEDEEYLANYIGSILGDKYSCIITLNGEEGFKRAQEIIPDLIILDLIMPGICGDEVCKELKKNENTKHIPIIVLTGKSDLDTKLESLELGASEFLTKPFNKIELLTRVKSLLAQNKLSNLIKKKNIELNQTFKKLKETQDHLIQSEKMACLGRLASGMAHEIRNPINFIQNSAEPLKERFIEIVNSKNLSAKKIKEKKEDSLELFGILQEGVERILNVINGINTFTRGIARELGLFNINDAINGVLKVSKSEYKNVLDIRTDLKAKSAIKCNTGQMNQVVLNLFMNAVEALKEKKKSKGKIAIKTWEQDNEIKFSIKDNGPGIKEEDKQRIFDPFFTTKETKPGQNMGLGLSICYNIIDVHRGKIDVNSEIGKGVEFIVSLPVS